MDKLLLENNMLTLDIPSWATHVKLDVGTGYSAPMSQVWLKKEPKLFVFGFEPRKFNIDRLLAGPEKIEEWHGEPIDKSYINTRFKLIPCALSDRNGEQTFYHAWDTGTGSLYRPNEAIGKNIGQETVKVLRLDRFLDFFPWDRFPHIDYMKLDTQGSDLDVLKGCEKYLDKIVYITVECIDNENQYYGVTNSVNNVTRYLENRGFIRVWGHPNIADPTFFNTKWPTKRDTWIWQKG